MKKKVLIVSSFLLFFFYLVFSHFVAKGTFNRLDFNTTVELQNHLSTNWDTFFSVLSLLGSIEVTTIILLAILLWRKKVAGGLFIFVLYGLALVTELLGKTLVYHPGPPSLFFRYDLGFLFPSSYVDTAYSYPSGHALRTSFIIIILGTLLVLSPKVKRLTKFIWGTILLFFFFFMMISRISLGEHWTTDVIAGMFVGVSAALLAIIPLIVKNKFQKYRQWDSNPRLSG